MRNKTLTFLKHFFRIKRHVYLDHNATTNVSTHVRHKMNNVIKNYYGNPSSLYGIARKSFNIMEEARQQVASAINSNVNEIYFTSCATESNNAVLKSVSKYYYPKKKKIISTPIEHHSMVNTLEYLETVGIVVEYCNVDRYGRVVLAELEKMIDEDTFLICCMLANNEIGTIQDIPAITQIAGKHNVLVMSDCVQAFGKIPIDVQKLGVDYATFSAHKLHGPKGIGALYVKQGRHFSPFIHGGQQEDGMRAGTESLHNIAGFGAACEDIKNLLANIEQIRTLKAESIKLFRKIKPDCIINSPDEGCLSNTLSITFPNINNAGLMSMLDYNGIAVSAGSACSTEEKKPSHVLKAIGLSDKAARETIRISFGCASSLRDIRYTVNILKDYFEGRTLSVNMISPVQLNEYLLFDEDTYILDVRPQFLRKKFKGLPNSHEASLGMIKKYLPNLPKDKHILVVCQGGYLSYIAAYYLKSKGFENISSLLSGIEGWKLHHSDLYYKYTEQDNFLLQSL